MIKKNALKFSNNEFIKCEYLCVSMDDFFWIGIIHTSTSETLYKLIYIDFFLVFTCSSSFHTHMRGLFYQIIHFFGIKVLFLVYKAVTGIHVLIIYLTDLNPRACVYIHEKSNYLNIYIICVLNENGTFFYFFSCLEGYQNMYFQR